MSFGLERPKADEGLEELMRLQNKFISEGKSGGTKVLRTKPKVFTNEINEVQQSSNKLNNEPIISSRAGDNNKEKKKMSIFARQRELARQGNSDSKNIDNIIEGDNKSLSYKNKMDIDEVDFISDSIIRDGQDKLDKVQSNSLNDMELEIEKENNKLLESLSPQKILELRRELLSNLNPELVNKLQNKNNNKPISTNSNSNTNSDIEKLKLAWTVDPTENTTKDNKKEFQFNFQGEIINDNKDSIDIPTYHGLHHHGNNPTLPGYTLDELLLLSRSTQLNQRMISFRLITKILLKLRHNDYKFDNDDKIRDKIYNKLGILGWSLSLRLGLDDTSLNLQLIVLEAIHSWLVGDIKDYESDDKLINNTFKLCNKYLLISYSSVYQSIDGCFDSDCDDDDDSNDNVDSMGYQVKLVQYDPLYGFIKMNLHIRLLYLLQQLIEYNYDNEDREGLILRLLIRLTQHSSLSNNLLNQSITDVLFDMLFNRYLLDKVGTGGLDLDTKLLGITLIYLLLIGNKLVMDKLMKVIGWNEAIVKLLMSNKFNLIGWKLVDIFSRCNPILTLNNLKPIINSIHKVKLNSYVLNGLLHQPDNYCNSNQLVVNNLIEEYKVNSNDLVDLNLLYKLKYKFSIIDIPITYRSLTRERLCGLLTGLCSNLLTSLQSTNVEFDRDQISLRWLRRFPSLLSNDSDTNHWINSNYEQLNQLWERIILLNYQSITIDSINYDLVTRVILLLISKLNSNNIRFIMFNIVFELIVEYLKLVADDTNLKRDIINWMILVGFPVNRISVFSLPNWYSNFNFICLEEFQKFTYYCKSNYDKFILDFTKNNQITIHPNLHDLLTDIKKDGIESISYKLEFTIEFYQQITNVNTTLKDSLLALCDPVSDWFELIQLLNLPINMIFHDQIINKINELINLIQPIILLSTNKQNNYSNIIGLDKILSGWYLTYQQNVVNYFNVGGNNLTYLKMILLPIYVPSILNEDFLLVCWNEIIGGLPIGLIENLNPPKIVNNEEYKSLFSWRVIEVICRLVLGGVINRGSTPSWFEYVGFVLNGWGLLGEGGEVPKELRGCVGRLRDVFNN